MPDTDPHKAPLGHSKAAHRVHGWCSHCPDHNPAEEVIAWRTHENGVHAAENADDQIIAAVTEYRECAECGQEGALAVVTVKVRTSTGRRKAGGWMHCLNCEAVPPEATCAGT